MLPKEAYTLKTVYTNKPKTPKPPDIENDAYKL